MRSALLLCVVLLINGCASLGPNSSNTSHKSDFSDAHSQSVYAILEAIHAPKLVRIGMTTELAASQGHLPKAYTDCVLEQLTDELIYQNILPVYRNHIAAEPADKLAKFFATESGKKFAIFARIGGGEQIDPPTITPEDTIPYLAVSDYVPALSSPQLLRELEQPGYTMGLQAASQCMHTIKRPPTEDTDWSDSRNRI